MDYSLFFELMAYVVIAFAFGVTCSELACEARQRREAREYKSAMRRVRRRVREEERALG